MDALTFTLCFLTVAILWSLLAPFDVPTTKPTADDLTERQAQIDRANHTELL